MIIVDSDQQQSPTSSRRTFRERVAQRAGRPPAQPRTETTPHREPPAMTQPSEQSRPNQPENRNEQLQQGVQEVRHAVERREIEDHREYFKKHQAAKELEGRIGKAGTPEDVRSLRDLELAEEEEETTSDRLNADVQSLSELNKINEYIEHQDSIERDRAILENEIRKAELLLNAAREQRGLEPGTISDLEANIERKRQELASFDTAKIPASLRGEDPLPLESQDSPIRQAYEQQVARNLGHLRDDMNRIRHASRTTTEEPAEESEIIIEPETETSVEVNGDAQMEEFRQQLARMTPEQRDRYILEQDIAFRNLKSVIDTALKAVISQNPNKKQLQNNIFQASRIINKVWHNLRNQQTTQPIPESTREGAQQPQLPEDHSDTTPTSPTQSQGVPEAPEHLEPPRNESQPGQTPMVSPEQYDRSRAIVFAAIAKGATNVTNGPEVIDAASDVIRFVNQKKIAGESVDRGLEEFANHATDIQTQLSHLLH